MSVLCICVDVCVMRGIVLESGFITLLPSIQVESYVEDIKEHNDKVACFISS